MPDEERDQVARGLAIGRRRRRLGFNKSEFARRAGIYRSTLDRIESGRDGVRESTLIAAERALDAVDEEWDKAIPDPVLIRFVVQGFYGAESLVVEGPVENIAELEAAVERIMKRKSAPEDDA